MATYKDIDPRGFLLNDNDTGVDHLGESTFADAIAESVHHVDTPITIGLFAKWGSGKSFLLRHIESILKRYQRQSETDNVKTKKKDKCECHASCFGWGLCTALIFLLIVGTAFLTISPEIIVSLLGINIPVNGTTNSTVVQITPAPDLPSDQLQTLKILGFVFLPIEILLVFIVGCCGNSWLSLNYYGSCRLLTYGAFTKLPIRNSDDDIVEDPGAHPDHVLKHVRHGDVRLAMAASETEVYPRRYIFIDFKAWEYTGSDTLWAGIVTKITDAIEEEFGVITARMFRMLTIEELPRKVLSGVKTIYVELSSACKEPDVLDMMKQYGVVEAYERIVSTESHGKRIWRIQYSSDGECRVAMEFLAIEGIKYTEYDPTVKNGKAEKQSHLRFYRRQSGRQSKKALLKKKDGVEMRPFQNGRAAAEVDQDVLNNLKIPSQGLCCNRFCSHFIKYPTKLLCLPRLTWWILILLCSICIPVIAYAIANYFGLDLYRTYREVPVAGQIFLWMPAGIAVSSFACKFVWAMFHSQRKRVNAALDGTRNNMAEQLGFMSKVKNEIKVVSKLVQCARFTHQKDYKIVIAIDDLDRVPMQKIQSVLEAVNILLSDKSSPFICFVAVDPRVAAKCIEEGMGEVIRQSKITGYEYLKKIINLPICLPEISDLNKKRFIAGLIDQADHTVTYRRVEEETRYRSRNDDILPVNYDGDADGVEEVDSVDDKDSAEANGLENSLPPRRSLKAILELDHKSFLFHCRKYIYHNAELHKHMQGNPRNIKRLFNVISLTASIINSFLKKQRRREFIQSHAVEMEGTAAPYTDPDRIERTEEFAEDLVKWIVLADQWPYRTSYILQVIEDAEQRKDAGLHSEKIPEDWTIFEIFQEKVKEECEKGDQTHLSLDADPDLFYSYISLLKKNDFKTTKIHKLQKYTLNLDYSIRHNIAFQRDLSVLNENNANESIQTDEKTTIQTDEKTTPIGDLKTVPEVFAEDKNGNKVERALLIGNHPDSRRFSLPLFLLHHPPANLHEV